MPKLQQSRNVKTVITAYADMGIAHIRIVDYIGSEESGSRSIRNVVDEMLRTGVNEAEVYLNTQGGDVFESVEMTNQLLRFKAVKIRTGSLVASAGTYFTSKFHTIGRSGLQMMIHKPSMWFNGNENEMQQQAKLLNNLTQEYRKAYAAKTKMTEDQVEELWVKGDYWMDADEALEKGFIDEIAVDENEIPTEEIALLQACAAPHIPNILNTNNNKSKMEKLQLIAALGMPADATDEQIALRIADNKQKAEAYAMHQEAAEKLRKLKAKQLVEAAVVAKKITAEEAVSYTALAEADYDNVEKVLAAKASLPKLSAALEGNQEPGAEGANGVPAARANWTLNQWLENDPKAFAALERSDPETFKRINDAYFNAK